MDLPSKDVHKVLVSKGIAAIHHANSVITACQFLRGRALLSRGTIERRRMFQTPQASDPVDRRRGLWFDVFTDSVDIHARAAAINFYGPVLFVLDVDLIRDAYTGKVWVTKLNPTKWDGTKREDRWFQSIDDLTENFTKGDFNQMIVFRHCGGELPMAKYLKHIVLDDPKMKEKKSNIDYFSMAYGALKLAMTEGGIEVPIQRRGCAGGCGCAKFHAGNPKWVEKMYVPTV